MNSCGSIPFEGIYFRTAGTNIAKYSYSLNKRQFFYEEAPIDFEKELIIEPEDATPQLWITIDGENPYGELMVHRKEIFKIWNNIPEKIKLKNKNTGMIFEIRGAVYAKCTIKIED